MYTEDFFVIDVIQIDSTTSLAFCPLSEMNSPNLIPKILGNFTDKNGNSFSVHRFPCEFVSLVYEVTDEQRQRDRIISDVQSHTMASVEDCTFKWLHQAPFILTGGNLIEPFPLSATIEMKIHSLAETADFIANTAVSLALLSKKSWIKEDIQAAENMKFFPGLWLPIEVGTGSSYGMMRFEEELKPDVFRVTLFHHNREVLLSTPEIIRRKTIYETLDPDDLQVCEVTIGKLIERNM